MKLGVLGGGVSGLTVAYRAAAAAQVRVFEAGRVGGWIQTEDVGGFQFEQGPRSFRPKGNGVHLLRLIEELGLCDEVRSVEGEGSRRFVLWGGRPHELESSVLGLLRSPLTRTLPLLALREPLVRRTTATDESIHDFVSRRFSPAVAETLASAMVAGIFAGDPRRLSVRSCLPALWEAEQEHGSVVLGMGRAMRGGSDGSADSAWVRETGKKLSVSFQGGMGVLPRALAAGLDVTEGARAVALEPLDSAGRTRVAFEDGSSEEFDRVVSTLSDRALAALLPRSGGGAALADRLRALPTASVGLVNMGFAEPDLLGDLAGFGYLVPAGEDSQLLGMSWDSSAFPSQQPESTRITAMIGGARFPGVSALASSPEGREELVAIALDRLRRHMGIEAAPAATLARVHLNCIPQYAVGHHEVVQGLREECRALLPGVELLGNSFGGVGVADCVAAASSLFPSSS